MLDVYLGHVGSGRECALLHIPALCYVRAIVPVQPRCHPGSAGQRYEYEYELVYLIRAALSELPYVALSRGALSTFLAARKRPSGKRHIGY